MAAIDHIQIIEEFIDFCKLHLKIQELPKITFIDDRSWVLSRHSFGEYMTKNKSMVMYIKNRNLADILRTLAHELCHHRQNELGLLKPDSGKTGSPVENEANIVAGMILREFGKSHEMIYESLKTNLIKQLLREDINSLK